MVTMRLAVCLLIALVLSFPCRATAQGGEQNSVISLPADFLIRSIRIPNAEIRVSVSEILKAQKEKQEVILVDVRRAKEFDKIQIPGSINIPLYLIKTKTFLKDKFVVLLNEGYAYSQLEDAHDRLKELGFKKIFILDGGLNAWRQAATLAGDPFVVEKLAEVSPKEFFLERHFSNWTVIDISSVQSGAGQSVIPEAVSLPYTGKGGDFITQLQKFSAEVSSSKEILSLVLIMDEEGQRYGEIRRLTRKAGITVYYLTGGLAGYKNFLQRQALILNPTKMKDGVEVCPTCP